MAARIGLPPRCAASPCWPLLVALTLTLGVGPVRAAGGRSVLYVDIGPIGVTGGTPGDFSARLQGSDQWAYATLGTYRATDQTGTGAGWTITVQATRVACTVGSGACPPQGDALPAGSLVMAPPTVAPAAGTDGSGRAAAPSIVMTGDAAIDSQAGAIRVAFCPIDTCMGSYIFTPGIVAGTSGNGELQLAVPSYTYAALYHSTVTVSIIEGPP